MNHVRLQRFLGSTQPPWHSGPSQASSCGRPCKISLSGVIFTTSGISLLACQLCATLL